jgi:hypothetical protein
MYKGDSMSYAPFINSDFEKNNTVYVETKYLKKS